MAILSKGCKPDNHKTLLNHTTLQNLALQIFEVFIQILLNVNLSLNQTFLRLFLYVRQTWTTQLILAITLRRVIFL